MLNNGGCGRSVKKEGDIVFGEKITLENGEVRFPPLSFAAALNGSAP
jgi:hypothetical protein